MHALVPGDTTALMYIDGTSLNKKLEKQDHSKARVMCDRYALGCELWAITYGHHIRPSHTAVVNQPICFNHGCNNAQPPIIRHVTALRTACSSSSAGIQLGFDSLRRRTQCAGGSCRAGDARAGGETAWAAMGLTKTKMQFLLYCCYLLCSVITPTTRTKTQSRVEIFSRSRY